MGHAKTTQHDQARYDLNPESTIFFTKLIPAIFTESKHVSKAYDITTQHAIVT
jgi:hypothetical protein